MHDCCRRRYRLALLAVLAIVAALIPLPALAAGAAARAPSLALAPTSAPPPGLARSLPRPPRRPGCYHRINDVWAKVACESRAEVKIHVPKLTEDDDGISAAKVDGSMGPPLNFGSLVMTFDSVGSETDSMMGPNAFSIQNNTNFFTGTNGATDWVQFFDASQPGFPDQVCIQEWDVTLYYKEGFAYQPYTNSCAMVSWAVPQHLAAGYAPFVDGFIAGGLLWVLAYLPWGASGDQIVASSAPDLFGLASRWHGVSSGIFGWGNSSQAVFSSAEVDTSMTAGDCLFVPATKCPGAETKYLSTWYGATGESNNLIPVIGSPPAHLAPIRWLDPHAASISYVVTTTGRCPTGTKPPDCSPG